MWYTRSMKKLVAPQLGEVFGRLTVLRECLYVTKSGTTRRGLEVQCSCENATIKVISLSEWTKTKSCGCAKAEVTGRPIINEVEIGQVFGRLTVLELTRLDNRRAVVVRCSCPAQTIKTIDINSVVGGLTTSCGCYRSEIASQRMSEVNSGDFRIDDDGRECSGACGEYKPWSEYYETSSKHGHVAECKDCKKDRSKAEPRYLIDDEGRQCSYAQYGNCNQSYRPWSDFNKGNGARGYASWCRDCSAQHNQNIPVEQRRTSSLARTLRRYSLTVESYTTLFDKYSGCCWLCRKPETKLNPDGSVQRLSVDHDHGCCDFDPSALNPICGKCIRGLTCHGCNLRVLGNVDKIGADKVFDYLANGHVNIEELLP